MQPFLKLIFRESKLPRSLGINNFIFNVTRSLMSLQYTLHLHSEVKVHYMEDTWNSSEGGQAAR